MKYRCKKKGIADNYKRRNTYLERMGYNYGITRKYIEDEILFRQKRQKFDRTSEMQKKIYYNQRRNSYFQGMG